MTNNDTFFYFNVFKEVICSTCLRLSLDGYQLMCLIKPSVDSLQSIDTQENLTSSSSLFVVLLDHKN